MNIRWLEKVGLPRKLDQDQHASNLKRLRLRLRFRLRMSTKLTLKFPKQAVVVSILPYARSVHRAVNQGLLHRRALIAVRTWSRDTYTWKAMLMRWILLIKKLTTSLLLLELRVGKDGRPQSIGRLRSSRHLKVYMWLVDSNGTIKPAKLSVREAMERPNGRRIMLRFNSEKQAVGDEAGLLSGVLGMLGSDYGKFPIYTRLRLYDDCYEPKLSIEENIENRPPGIDRDHWRWYLDYRAKPETKRYGGESTEISF
ncbi:hypothetical protein AHAS_Ahas04G0204800 [Arachis hypogaea]